MNIRRDLSRYLCLALAAGTISAQTVSISGTVTDTQAALPGVAVTLRSDAIAARSTTTDAKGAFLFERISHRVLRPFVHSRGLRSRHANDFHHHRSGRRGCRAPSWRYIHESGSNRRRR